MTRDEFIKMVVSNAKTKQWLNCTVTVQLANGDFQIGIKAFGKWVQRIELGGFVDSIPEQKTNKALAHELDAILNYCEARL